MSGRRLIDHLEAIGRKPTTITVYRSLLRTHIDRHLGACELDAVKPEHVERMIGSMRRAVPGPKTTVNDDVDIHYLEMAEIDALLRAVDDTVFGPDRPGHVPDGRASMPLSRRKTHWLGVAKVEGLVLLMRGEFESPWAHARAPVMAGVLSFLRAIANGVQGVGDEADERGLVVVRGGATRLGRSWYLRSW